MLDELGVDLDLHALQPERARRFIELLRDHAAREESLLYPWSESQLEKRGRRTLIARLRTVARELTPY